MPDLTLQNIEQITRDVRMQEISFSHLADELIDHVCCDVEHEMQNGLNFLEAYRKVNGKMGLRRLKEIQEETLYAVDTKYRKMKNTMKISGVSGTVLLGFAALFKIMHWPGAGIMLMLGGVILAFVFMPSAMVVLWKETHNRKRIFLYISAFVSAMFFILGTMFKIQHWPGAALILLLAGVSGIICFIPVLLISKLNQQENRSKRAIYIFGATALVLYIAGLLFKIQHWPGSGMLLMIALVILFFVVFPWYTVVTWKNESNITAAFLFMVIGSLAIVAPSTLISMNMQKTYESGYYLNQQEQQALFKSLLSENSTFVKSNVDTAVAPVLYQIVSKTNELLMAIERTEAKMISETEGEPGVAADLSHLIVMTGNRPEIQFNQLRRPFSPVILNDFFSNSSSSGKELDAGLKVYCDFITGLTPESGLNKTVKLLNPAVYFPCSDGEEKRVSLMSALHMTALMKNSIMVVESQALKTVAK